MAASLPIRLLVALAVAGSALAGAPARAEPRTVKLGYAKCAHCMPLSLTPQYGGDVKIDAIAFNTGNDVLTALLSHAIDVGQITYLHLVTALDRGFDLDAVSGQVNGGSQIVARPDLALKPDDWDGLKALIAQYKKDGKPFRIAASRGNAQDLHMRGALAAHGIDVNKDVQFVNIPNPPDDAPALRRGEVEMICTVEPFGSQIRLTGAGSFFAYPYDQAAGKLTNLMLTRPDVIKDDPQGVQAVVDAVVKVDGLIAADHALWVDTIVKGTGLDAKIAAAAVQNLYPDYEMHRTEAMAIAGMMHDLHYASKDVSQQVADHLDYQFLEKATGKPAGELGQ